MRRLRRHSQRTDRMVNDVRARRRYFGQWTYILVILLLFLWLADFLFGRFVFLRAEGMVTLDRQVIAVGYVGRVEHLPVIEGQRVEAGEVVARLRSTQILENTAQLSSRLVEAEQRRLLLEARRRSLLDLAPIAAKRAEDMTAIRERHEEGLRRGVATTIQQREFLRDEYEAVLENIRVKSELSTIEAELIGLDALVANGRAALDEVRSAYGEGILRAPFAGIVSSLRVAEGSVVTGGEPMMELLVGEPYALAWMTPGSLARMEIGDRVALEFGVEEMAGTVTGLFPVSQQLPVEFQKTFRPAERSQIFRIDLDEDAAVPPTFTKVEVRAPGSAIDRAGATLARVSARFGLSD